MPARLHLALCCAAWLVGWSGPGATVENQVIVRNAKNPTTSVTRAEIKDLVVGRKKVWPFGSAVQLVLAPPGSPELSWLAGVMGVPDQVLMNKIKQEVFKGEMSKPVLVTSDQDCLAVVAANPGAFGVVSASAARKLPAQIAAIALK
jgi:ABC-type phosphate transport system substrate-binding protein